MTLTSNSSKLELLLRIFLWFEMPSYSTHTFELLKPVGKAADVRFPVANQKVKIVGAIPLRKVQDW